MREKLLIINADDFGSSSNANAAIGDLLENRHISSASVMVNGACYQEALNMIQTMRLNNIGVHLTVTNDEYDVEKPVLLRSLLHLDSLRTSRNPFSPLCLLWRLKYSNSTWKNSAHEYELKRDFNSDFLQRTYSVRLTRYWELLGDTY